MACGVVFCTVYALILPAITLEKPPDCGIPEHIHTAECYTKVVTEAVTETETVSENEAVPLTEPETETVRGSTVMLICTPESLGIHKHTDDCFDVDGNLLCGYADFLVHEHDSSCFDESGSLWCSLPEVFTHRHTRDCYIYPEAAESEDGGLYDFFGGMDGTLPDEPIGPDGGEDLFGIELTSEDGTDEFEIQLEAADYDADGEAEDEEDSEDEEEAEPEPVLVCGEDDVILHEHDDSCFDEYGRVICGMVQVLEHVHTDGCFEEVEEVETDETDETAETEETEGTAEPEDELTCTIPEGDLAHIHGDECYDNEGNLVCGLEENEGHVHTELCYGTWELSCGLDEHTHTEECYETKTERESAEIWEATLPDPMPEDLRDALLAVAQSQLGYSEMLMTDENDFVGRYTRYGDWAGDKFGEWGTAFVSFCLEYAGVGEDMLPREETCEGWVEALQSEEWGLYFAAGEGYTPLPGDLVFLDEDEIPDGIADAVGIVAEVYSDVEGRLQRFTAVCGDVDGAVKSGEFSADDGAVAGFAALPVEVEVMAVDEGIQPLADKPTVFTDTLSPSSSIINVFDYWVLEDGRIPNGSDNKDSGINKGRTLLFRSKNSKNQNPDSLNCNLWEESKIQQGIVANKLVNGYPILSGNAKVGYDTESLAYLFDPDNNTDYRKAFKNVTGLLYDDNGYYTYDSTQHYAYLNEENFDSYETETGNKFTLYNARAVTFHADVNDMNDGEFFPFNDYPSNPNIDAGSNELNHYFGLTLTARFIQKYDGHVNAGLNSKDTIFSFSGDDDVWIFIDDVLVVDLGGIHDRMSTSINFATGKIELRQWDNENTISDENGVIPDTTIRACFEAALSHEEFAALEWNGDTFADDTKHTLKFFYMERGYYASNMKLQYNMLEIPPTAIYKINQYGNPIEEVSFDMYKAEVTKDAEGNEIWVKADADDNPYNGLTPAYSGTTNANGELVFANELGVLSMNDLKELFGDYFIMKETKVPDGYRKIADEIHISIQDGALVCENTYDTGVWATPTLLATAPSKLKMVDTSKDNVDYYNIDSEPNGTMFAVVLKYVGDAVDVSEDSLMLQKNWEPVSGNPTDGYKLYPVKGDKDDFIRAALEAVKTYGTTSDSNPHVFKKSPSGIVTCTLEQMPGKINQYYHMIKNVDISKTRYTVAYYWTSASDLSGATSENTWRVDSEADEPNSFYREFGANIEVPNLANRLLVQKFDDKGNLLNGATFALFKANEDGTYVDINGDEVDLTVDKVKSISVTQAVYKDPDDVRQGLVSPGVTTIKTESGAIIKSHEQRVTNSDVLQDSDGTCVFGIWGVDLVPGCYYLREVQAPAGYQLNETEIMVRVTEDAIYANAGTADDNVAVARGPGYIVSPLHKAASVGEINVTLTWIYQKLKVSKVSSSFADAVLRDVDKGATWDYLTDEKGLILSSFLKYTREAKALGSDRYVSNYAVDEDPDRVKHITDSTDHANEVRTATQLITTEVGWSYNEIYQDTDYGRSQIRNSTEYTEMKGKDISNLFSRSVFVQVRDEPCHQLPETGGKGTGLYAISGTVLTGAAGVMLFKKRRDDDDDRQQ